MKIEIIHYFLLIGMTMYGIITNSITFNPIQFQCDNYILNSYLYFILSWAIIMATNQTLFNNKVELHDLFSGPFTILLMVSTLALLVGLLYVPPKMFFTKHLLYIIEIVLLGIFLYPYFKNNQNIFYNVALVTLAMLVILSIISYKYPSYINESWGGYLLFALIGLILIRFAELFSGVKYKSRYSRLVSYASIVLFSFFIMYDTKKLIVNAENCVNPDYINESLHLFLDSINLFQNLYYVSE